MAVSYVVLLALIAFGVPLAVSLRDRVDSEVRSQARSQADIVAAGASERLGEGDGPGLRRLVEASGDSVRGRVIVVDRSGQVVADSAGQVSVGESYESRPEIQAALAGNVFQDTRHSDTLGKDILATAVPVVHENQRVGAVRVTESVDAVNSAVTDATLTLALLAGGVLVLGIIGAALISQQIARPIRRLETAADSVAHGDLRVRAPVEGTEEQRSLARSFNDMTERVERLLHSQRDFVADASHQLRTPLTGLRLQLEELIDDGVDTDEEARRLAAGIHEVDRLSQIVDELLILSRAGEREVPGEMIDLTDAADRAAMRWQGPAAEAGVTLERNSEGVLAEADCARADVDRALDALIENAVVYSPQGGTVKISDGPGLLEIADEGPGLEPGEEEIVFERFHRGRAGRLGPQGTGLGLAIARELIATWGGTVELSSQPGRGAVASIALPPVRSEHAGERSVGVAHA